MNLSIVKKEIEKHIGDSVTIRYNLGRNKFEKYEAVIKELYNYVFLVELYTSEIKSFSYVDIITKTIKIDY